MRTVVLGLLFVALPGCVAAIGNTGYGLHTYPSAAAPLLQERVSAANRIVELRQRLLDTLRDLAKNSRVGDDAVIAAEIELEEAKLHLVECRIDLNAAEGKKKE
jgi:hypothetical protein